MGLGRLKSLRPRVLLGAIGLEALPNARLIAKIPHTQHGRASPNLTMM